MKKILISLLLLFPILATGCGKQDIWQGSYYKNGLDENEEYGPIFNNYEACKSWAINKISNSDDHANCSKNCHDTMADGTPVCESVVRNWAPLPVSDTFDNYKE